MMNAEQFAINGRFLSQNMTGVQRYALNVVRSLDEQIAGGGRGVVLAPHGVENPGLRNLRFVQAGGARGHAWEQLTLPLKWRGRLLNLGNTAPVLHSDQIVCIHDANIFAAPETYSRSFRALYGTLLPLLVKRSAQIATVSQASARQLGRYLPIDAKDIVVLPNGHEHALAWDPDRAEIAPKFLSDAAGAGDRPFVLALGSRARHKNIGLLMTVADELDAKGIDIIVAGGGAGIYNSDDLAARRNVRLIGRISDHDLAYLLDRALCLAFPSFTEGFGLPIVEAMARGCPVVSSDRASMPEVCGRAALMASPEEPAAWIRHIERLKQSQALRAELVGSGHEQVRKFSWANTAAGYRDLIERSPSPATAYRPSSSSGPKTAVVMATRGRPDVVTATIEYLLANQSVQPDVIIISCVHISDAGGLVNNPKVRVITGKPGLAAQRNTALNSLPGDIEIVAFFDDDFVANGNWLAAAATVFRDESKVVGFTGFVLADGITTEAISFQKAVQLVETVPAMKPQWIEGFSPYGCNMAFRMSAIGKLRFDERLVLYGWLEDRDFGASIARGGGRLVKCSDATGVHMGTKGGRVSGQRLGYSQIVNPIYMLLKGTISLKKLATHIGANMASNFGKALWPEPFIDRRGRAMGNLIGIADVLRGRIQPERAEGIGQKAKQVSLRAEIKSE